MQSENMTEPPAYQPEQAAGNKLVGRLFVVMIFALAILMASFAVWVKYSQGRRTLELWGTRPTWLIRHASQVHLIRLAAADRKKKGPVLSVLPNGPALKVTSIVEVSDRIGLTNARHMLIMDRSYRWDTPPASDPRFTFALEFREGDEGVVLLFAPESGVVQMQNTSTQVMMGDKIETLEEYLNFSTNGPLTNRPVGQ